MNDEYWCQMCGEDITKDEYQARGEYCHRCYDILEGYRYVDQDHTMVD